MLYNRPVHYGGRTTKNRRGQRVNQPNNPSISHAIYPPDKHAEPRMPVPQVLPALSALPPPASDWLENCSPKARLLCTLLLTLTLVLSAHIGQAGGLCLLGLLLAGLARIAPMRIFRTLISINIFMLFVWISLPFTVGGTMLFSFHVGIPLQISREGTELAALLSLKANGAALFLLALCGSLPLHAVGRTLQSCGLPHKLVILFILLIRHISHLRQEFKLSLHSLRLRTSHIGGIKRLQIHACLVCSLLVRSADHAEKVRMALECKPAGLLYAENSAPHKSLWSDAALCTTTCGLLCLSLV